MKVLDLTLCLLSHKLGLCKKLNIHLCCAWCREWYRHSFVFLISDEVTVGKGTTIKEEIKLRNLTFGLSACCRLTWIHHLYLWQNSVSFCCPAENKWSFFRTLTVSLELPRTLWSTEIGTSPCILSTPHIRQALLQPAKSIWLMADFHPQPFYP